MEAASLWGLRSDLAKASQRLQAHRGVYEANETAVREQIVLPILRSLGWDTESPDDVHPEARSDVGSPDYTLKSNDRGVVIIEVKNAAVDVAQPGALEQAHRYASAKGVGLCLATNGAIWVLARSFEEGRDLRGRIVWQALLSEGTVDDVAQKLSFIAKANVASINTYVELQDEIAQLWQNLLEEPAELVTMFVTLLKARLPNAADRLPYEGFIENHVEQRVREMLDGGFSQPMPSGEEEEVAPATGERRGFNAPVRQKSCAEILVDAAERAIKDGRLLPTDTMDSGPARYLIGAKPIHKNGKDFFNPRRLSNGLYIETHHSREQARKLASKIDARRRRGRGQ